MKIPGARYMILLWYFKAGITMSFFVFNGYLSISMSWLVGNILYNFAILYTNAPLPHKICTVSKLSFVVVGNNYINKNATTKFFVFQPKMQTPLDVNLENKRKSFLKNKINILV